MFVEVDPGDGKPLPDGGRDPGREHRAGHRPGRVPLGARHGHAQLPQAADLRRRQGPRRPRHRPARDAASGSARCTSDLARVSRAVAERRHEHAPAREPLRPADDRARQERQGHHPARARARTRCSAPSPTRTRTSRRSSSKLPGTLNQTAATLGKVDTLAQQMGPTLRVAAAAVPPARRREPAVLPFVKRGGADPARTRSARSRAPRSRSSATSAARPRTCARRTRT